MIFSEPTMLCEASEQAFCPARSLCSVLFEAPTLPWLGRQLIRWLQMHQSSAPVVFSHVQETRGNRGPVWQEQEKPYLTRQVSQRGEDPNAQIEHFLQRKDHDETTLLS